MGRVSSWAGDGSRRAQGSQGGGQEGVTAQCRQRRLWVPWLLRPADLLSALRRESTRGEELPEARASVLRKHSCGPQVSQTLPNGQGPPKCPRHSPPGQGPPKRWGSCFAVGDTAPASSLSVRLHPWPLGSPWRPLL